MIWIDGVLVSEGKGGVYGEKMLRNCRIWDPYRSKLAAYYHKGCGHELRKDDVVLYLGAANGTTVSHVADYTECVYAVEFAPRPMQDLLAVAAKRKNIVPIMADASRPEWYAPLLEPVDLLYMDVADPDQIGIASRNSVFLKQSGIALLMLKTRSIDVRSDPGDVLAESIARLEESDFVIQETMWLLPYHQDHAAILCAKK
ncbi:MAG TPA: fibrillarin-like rRNA/tRNA 2'-O-methyltransferase [Methanoregulaceae archaeon]|jgi:fibrillarin-like pre-rRNA processing protein|nr:fibrillarin-like rRNA/tRNA 2'-O-methyltransferase [Methanolinea sp.]MCC7566820.1 fibrillarin-like rRNA/tRNA 2'-O-methyltransferase [Methanoregulaceae archaeon]MDD3092028.1 fibrillarin-like rRNA/tRNA 2'-O-methyltransferase [Methanoregulaceae archaeon]MDD5047921.1 fibrillarin-like rRNA/tRNA 2'-O-methyltransferase [Methanoregulaceae archaeon]MDD5684581.1 fibrillarin-like rRNA/tRNA 2'-O-methyltransferase [Methanoregulaceae archaeon]